MNPSEKSRQILDQFDIQHEPLELMIEEALNEARAEGLELVRMSLNKRISLLQRQLDANPKHSFLASAINHLTLVLEDLEERQSV